MNMEKIEAEIRMFDRIELVFAIGAAAAAAVLLIVIAVRMRRNEVKPGKAALIISMAVLAVTGIYTGTVVFAYEGSLMAENESPHMELVENEEVPWDAAIEITGIASEGSCLIMIVTDAEEDLEETYLEEAAGAEMPAEEMPAEETLEEKLPAEKTPEEEMPAEETLEEELLTEETHAQDVQNVLPLCEDIDENGEAEDMAAETAELSEETVESTELSEEAAGITEQSEEVTGITEQSEEAEAPEGTLGEITVKEIKISLSAGTQYDDAAAREMVMAEQAEHFDAAGLVLKDTVIEDGFLRSLVFGLRETGVKYIRVSLIGDGDTQEIELFLYKDETVNNDDMTVAEGEAGQQTGGDVPEDDHADQEIVYEEEMTGEGQTPGENNVNSDEEQTAGENDADIDEEQTPAESDELNDGEEATAEDNEKIKEDKEPPVIIIRPDDEGSGFKISADTEEAVSNAYISEAKEVRIIETNAEEIEEVEIVYTVNGETRPMEYGSDYEIEKVTTDEGWQYEYVVAPHVFEKDGYYNINITSRDKSGNISNNKTAGTEVSFVVDRTPPAVIVTNLADGGVYKDGGHEYKVTLKDNTLLKYFRIYENKKLKTEYLYDREKWINTRDKTDVLEAPGGTVTLRTDASGEKKTIEFEAEDESGNIYRSGSYSIIAGKSRSSKVIPFAVTAALVTIAAAIAVKYSQSRKSAARQKTRGRR